MNRIDGATRDRLVQWSFRVGFILVGLLTLYVIAISS